MQTVKGSYHNLAALAEGGPPPSSAPGLGKVSESEHNGIPGSSGQLRSDRWESGGRGDDVAEETIRDTHGGRVVPFD